MSRSEVRWFPDDDFLRDSNIARFAARHALASYEDLRGAWIDDPGWFWGAVADDFGISWYEEPDRVLDRSRGNPRPRWFPGGVTNLVEWCIERHDPGRVAYLWEGEEGSVRSMNFGELSTLVARIAGGLRAAGVVRGDCVGLFMPLVPEALASMFACAKIGAICVPMFSGYAPEPVTSRLRQTRAKVLLSADGFYRRGRAVDMRTVAEEAARGAPTVERVVLFSRLRAGEWESLLEAEPVAEPEPVPSDHAFLIAYTSGTTGMPKGAVHAHAGFPLKAATETGYHLDQRDGDLLFWMTDLGWIVAPLMSVGAALHGNPLFLYDGAPDHPTASRIAELVQHHSVRIFGTSPTFVRALMRREDHGFDESPPSLRVLGSTGEPWNDAPWLWFFEQVGGSRCPVINLCGGTEAGSLLGALPTRPLKPSSFNSSCVGVDTDLFHDNGRPAAPGELGELVVKQPWPGQTQSFWDDDARYLASYWLRWPEVWTHGDWGTRDEEGFWWLHGRSDDTMIIAGKRIGPTEIESVLASHDAVVESAAVGIPDEVKGEALWCLVVVRRADDGIEQELRTLVSDRLGKPFSPERVVVVPALPRTRNAKIIRRAIAATVAGVDAGDLTSLENPEALDEIRRIVLPTPPEFVS
jgi:acetyl-CoA synthetase